MTKKRINITVDIKKLQKIDDYVHIQKKKFKTNRSEFLIESALFKIEYEKRKRKVGSGGGII